MFKGRRLGRISGGAAGQDIDKNLSCGVATYDQEAPGQKMTQIGTGKLPQVWCEMRFGNHFQRLDGKRPAVTLCEYPVDRLFPYRLDKTLMSLGLSRPQHHGF
jgi:hypothetical protein